MLGPDLYAFVYARRGNELAARAKRYAWYVVLVGVDLDPFARIVKVENGYFVRV